MQNSAIIFGLAILFVSQSVFALQIVDTNQPMRGDFVLEPSKVKLEGAPGASQVVDLRITNRDSNTRTFTVATEDMTGSQDPSTPIILLGDKQGPYTMRNNLLPETLSFTLAPGQQITLPVTVNIPPDAEPGGRYASVIVSNSSQMGDVQMGSNTVARLTSLFFVTIPGTVSRSATLEKFNIDRVSNMFFDQSPVPFNILVSNTGNVHLDPSGSINITNIYGATVDNIRIDPFYAMPKSLRSRHIDLEHKQLIGRYTATLNLNMGYGSSTEMRTVTFWILPWQTILNYAGIAFAVILLLRILLSKIEIKVKK